MKRRNNEHKMGSKWVLITGVTLLVGMVSIPTLYYIHKDNVMEVFFSKVEDSSYEYTEEELGEELGEYEEEENKGPKNQIEEEKNLLVAVPTDEITLRETPGFGDDKIITVYAGTYLEWLEKSVTVDNLEFYKVRIRDTGEVGYLAANYCVPVKFVADEKALTTVAVDTALYTYEMMEADIAYLCEEYPDRLQSIALGESVDGRTIHGVILGNPEAENKVMVQAAIHGREYMTAQLVMKMVEYYAYYYDQAQYEQTTYRTLFEETAFYIVPMANPDGITISQLGIEAISDKMLQETVRECYDRDKMDRNLEVYGMTFTQYQKIWKANARGVDVNNNFDAGWKAMGLKKMPSFENYKGKDAVSEPEAQALVDLAKANDFSYYLNYHSKGQVIYYDVKGNKKATALASKELADLLANKVKYRPIDIGKSKYVNLGGFGDWAQLQLNKASVTIETGKEACPLEIDEFTAMWFRNRESWAYLCTQKGE